jgi:hypothetical protein
MSTHFGKFSGGIFRAENALLSGREKAGESIIPPSFFLPGKDNFLLLFVPGCDIMSV